MEKNDAADSPAAEHSGSQQSLYRDPFPLGVYPALDDDLPRDSVFENFTAPDLRDMRPYPWGLEQPAGHRADERQSWADRSTRGVPAGPDAAG